MVFATGPDFGHDLGSPRAFGLYFNHTNNNGTWMAIENIDELANEARRLLAEADRNPDNVNCLLNLQSFLGKITQQLPNDFQQYAGEVTDNFIPDEDIQTLIAYKRQIEYVLRLERNAELLIERKLQLQLQLDNEIRKLASTSFSDAVCRAAKDCRSALLKELVDSKYAALREAISQNDGGYQRLKTELSEVIRRAEVAIDLVEEREWLDNEGKYNLMYVYLSEKKELIDKTPLPADIKSSRKNWIAPLDRKIKEVINPKIVELSSKSKVKGDEYSNAEDAASTMKNCLMRWIDMYTTNQLAIDDFKAKCIDEVESARKELGKPRGNFFQKLKGAIWGTDSNKKLDELLNSIKKLSEREIQLDDAVGPGSSVPLSHLGGRVPQQPVSSPNAEKDSTKETQLTSLEQYEVAVGELEKIVNTMKNSSPEKAPLDKLMLQIQFYKQNKSSDFSLLVGNKDWKESIMRAIEDFTFVVTDPSKDASDALNNLSTAVTEHFEFVNSPDENSSKAMAPR